MNSSKEQKIEASRKPLMFDGTKVELEACIVQPPGKFSSSWRVSRELFTQRRGDNLLNMQSARVLTGGTGH